MDDIPPGSNLSPSLPSIDHRRGDQRFRPFDPDSAVISTKMFTHPVDRHASGIKNLVEHLSINQVIHILRYNQRIRQV